MSINSVPNKTIYVKDEHLWAKAKKLAEKEGEGLSGVISAALTAYVAERQAAASGDAVHRILVLGHGNEDVQRIAFAGQEIAKKTFGDPPVCVTVYETVGGNFVVTAAWDSEEPIPFYYKTYDHPLGLQADDVLLRWVEPPDLESWAKEIHLKHMLGRSTETWIE
jgi:hypothetical protein